MYNAIKKFLALYHHIILPGMGNFAVETNPARLDFVNRCITSCQYKIVFDNNKLPAEKKFYDFLAYELNIDKAHAAGAFSSFIDQLQDKLNKSNNIYFKGIGTLTKQTSNVVLFEPEAMPEYFPELVAERIIRKNVAHAVRVGEDEKSSDEMHVALNKPQLIAKEN